MVTDFVLLKHSSGCLAVSKKQEIVQPATHYHRVNGFFLGMLTVIHASPSYTFNTIALMW